MILLQAYLGLAWTLGCVAFGLLVVHRSVECRIARQYLTQAAVFVCGLCILALTAVQGNYHGYVLFAWIYGTLSIQKRTCVLENNEIFSYEIRIPNFSQLFFNLLTNEIWNPQILIFNQEIKKSWFHRHLLRRLPLQPENVHIRESQSEEFRENVGFRSMFPSHTNSDWSPNFR